MFALLQHTTVDGVHWDLLLELPGQPSLATWRLSQNPCEALAPVAATRIPDHRPLYLEFEGEISGGRGHVTRVDRGDAEVVQHTAEATLVQLAGTRLRGRFAITAEGGERLAFRCAD